MISAIRFREVVLMEARSRGQQPLLLGKEATLSRGVPEGKSGVGAELALCPQQISPLDVLETPSFRKSFNSEEKNLARSLLRLADGSDDSEEVPIQSTVVNREV